MTIESIVQILKHCGERITHYALALDTSPVEILQTELHEARREIVELQEKVGNGLQQPRQNAA